MSGLFFAQEDRSRRGASDSFSLKFSLLQQKTILSKIPDKYKRDPFHERRSALSTHEPLQNIENTPLLGLAGVDTADKKRCEVPSNFGDFPIAPLCGEARRGHLRVFFCAGSFAALPSAFLSHPSVFTGSACRGATPL